MRKEWKNSSLWPSVATEILSFQLHSPRTLHPASFPCQLTCISNKMSMAEHASRSKALWFPAGWSKHFQVDIPKYWYFQIWKTFNPIPDKKYSTYISRNAVLPYGWLNEKCSTCIISINVVPSTFSLVFFFKEIDYLKELQRGETDLPPAGLLSKMTAMTTARIRGCYPGLPHGCQCASIFTALKHISRGLEQK